MKRGQGSCGCRRGGVTRGGKTRWPPRKTEEGRGNEQQARNWLLMLWRLRRRRRLDACEQTKRFRMTFVNRDALSCVECVPLKGSTAILRAPSLPQAAHSCTDNDARGESDNRRRGERGKAGAWGGGIWGWAGAVGGEGDCGGEQQHTRPLHTPYIYRVLRYSSTITCHHVKPAVVCYRSRRRRSRKPQQLEQLLQ